MRSIHNSLLFLVCHEVDELKVEFNWKRYVSVSMATVRCSHSVSLHLRRVRVFNHLVCLILCQICLEVSNHHPPHPSHHHPHPLTPLTLSPHPSLPSHHHPPHPPHTITNPLPHRIPRRWCWALPVDHVASGDLFQWTQW